MIIHVNFKLKFGSVSKVWPLKFIRIYLAKYKCFSFQKLYEAEEDIESIINQRNHGEKI